MHPGWKKNYIRYKSIFLSVTGNYNKRPDVKAYLELLLSLITICVLAIFALRPTLLTISKLYKEIESKKNTLSKLTAKIEQIENAKDNYNDKEQSINVIYEAIPKNILADNFSGSINAVEENTNIQIITVDPFSMTENDPAKNNDSNEFSISADGDYQNLIGLMSRIENLRRLSEINNITLASTVNINGEKIIRLSLNGNIYHIP